MAAGSIVIEMMLKTGSFQSDTKRAERELERLRKQAQRLGTSNTFAPLEQGIQGVGKETASATKNVDAMGASLRNMAGYVAAAFSVGQIINYADAWTAAQGRLKLVVTESQNLADVNKQLFDVAQRTRQPLEATINFYSRLAQFIPEAERAQYDLLGVTESVTSALAITGETSASAMGAMIQFTQAIGTNFEASGQELRSLQEQAPRLTQALMKSFGDGTKSLQTLKEEGILTRESVLRALSGMGAEGAKLREELARIPVTFAQSMTQAKNNALQFIGQMNDSTGAVQKLAAGITMLAGNLDLVLTAIATFTALKFGSSLAAAASETVKATLATKAYAQAQMQAAAIDRAKALAQVEVAKTTLATAAATLNNAKTEQAAAAATIRLNAAKYGLVTANANLLLSTNALTASTKAYAAASSIAAIAARGLLALVGGPIGAITIAVTAGVYAWQKWGRTASEEVKRVVDLRGDISSLVKEFEKLTNLQQLEARNRMAEQLEAAVDTYDKEIKRLVKIASNEALIGVSIGFSNEKAFLDFKNSINYLLDDDDLSLKNLDRGLEMAITKLREATGSGDKMTESLIRQASVIIENRKNIDQLTNSIDAMSSAQNKVARDNTEADDLEQRKKALDGFLKDYATKGEQLAAERKKWRDTLGDLYTPAVDARILEKFTPKSRKKDIDEGQKIIDQLKERIALIGAETEAEKLLANIKSGAVKFRSKDAEQEALNYAASLDTLNEAAKQRNKLEEDGRALTESLLGPLQKYEQELEKLNQLRTQGAISAETYLRALVNIQQAYWETSDAGKEMARQQDTINRLLEATPSSQLKKQREDMIELRDALLRYQNGLDGVKITEEEFLEAVQARLGRTVDLTKTATDQMTEFAKAAAQNMQSAFADFLFDPFKDGADGMLRNFVSVLHRMASEMLASKVFEMLGSLSDKGGILGFIGSFANFGGAKATGGDVMSGRSYLVGERGPEMFTPRSAGSITPNNQLSGSAPVVNVRNINVLDPSIVGDYLGGDEGEQLIMNVVQRNRGALNF